MSGQHRVKVEHSQLRGCNVPELPSNCIDIAIRNNYTNGMGKRNSLIIYTVDGCWLQELVDGVIRSSYFGYAGTREEVREWCKSRGYEFVDFNAAPAPKATANVVKPALRVAEGAA